jgi:hypothetical protein
MQIHQMQLKYDLNADRLLLQVRTREAELFGVWLTRRMVSRLRPPFQQAVTRLGMARAAPQSMPVPEARAMLEQAVRDRPLPNADFAQPFETQGVSQPLGPEPLLPAEVDIRGLPTGGLALNLREARGRRLELALNDQLATALLRLLDQALAGAEWGLPTATAEAPTAPPGPLN